MITLQANWGSYPVVVRVYTFDPFDFTAHVRYRYSDRTERDDTVSLDELQALDERRHYVDVEEVVRQRAERIEGATYTPRTS